MAEPTPIQKILANIAFMRKHPKHYGKADMEEQIDKLRMEVTAANKSDRSLSGVEKVAAFGSKMGSGATFGLLDEAAELLPGSGWKDEQRFLQRGLEEDDGGLAFGAEVLGSLAVPGSFLKPAARTASAGMKALKVAGEGALQGGASAFGNAEGNLAERLDETAAGAGIGAGAAGAIGGASRMAARTVGNVAERMGLRAPNPQRAMEELADKTPDESMAAARQRLQENVARRLGDETMVADVLPEGEAALRLTGTQNKEARKLIDSELRERSNRLSNLSDERFSEYTGSDRSSAQRAVDQRIKKAQAEAGPEYAIAEAEAAAHDLTSAAPDFVTPVVLQRKPIQSLMRRVMADDPAVYGGKVEDVLADPKLSYRLFDQMYKDIGEDIRYLRDKVRAKTASASERRQIKRMVRDRAALLDAIKVRSPNYPKALDKYAGEIAHRDAYERGLRNIPSDMIPDELASLDPATVPDFKEATARRLRPKTANPELGEFARFRDVLEVFADPEKSAAFKATFGADKHQEYLKDLLTMARLQRMRGGMGESTTADKLIEQMEGDPEKIASLVRSLGNPLEMVAQAGRWDKVWDRLRQSKQAKENAGFWTTRGEGKVKAALDLLEKLRQEGKLPRPRNFRQPNPTAAAARIAGGIAGRP